ncbi:MAG: hypothetical protein QG610_1152 [Euryarchaeota archaeon]|nr:hypothetical protein [Euryarchaeota archaeon]
MVRVIDKIGQFINRNLENFKEKMLFCRLYNKDFEFIPITLDMIELNLILLFSVFSLSPNEAKICPGQEARLLAYFHQPGLR